MWLAVFGIGFPFALYKALREAIFAAMAGAYVYFCIPMREFNAPTAPYQALFWGLAALMSFRYAGMQAQWGTDELVVAAKNAVYKAIDEVREAFKNGLLSAASNREPEAEVRRKTLALCEDKAVLYVRKNTPSVIIEATEQALVEALHEAVDTGIRESHRLIETMPGANAGQLRATMSQRVAPLIEQTLDEVLEKSLGEKIEAAMAAAKDKNQDEAALKLDDPGDMPKARSPIAGIVTNSGFWMFMGFYLCTYIGSVNAVHRHSMAVEKVNTCKLLMIPIIAICMAVRTDRHFRLFTYAWMFGVWQLSVQAGKQWITFGGRIDDVGGQGGEANFLGAIIVCVAPIAFSMLLTEKDKWAKRAGWIGAGGYVLGILACGSRGAMCALVGQMGYWMLYTSKKGTAYFLGCIAVAGFLAVAPPEFIDRMATIIEKKDGGFSAPKVEESKRERQLLWKLAIEVFKDNPVMGVGPQQYTHHSALALPHLRGAYSGKPGLMTHNSWLQILAEYGVIGSFFWIGGYIWAFLSLRRARKVLKDYESHAWFRSYCLGFEAGMLGSAVAMTFSSFQWLDYIYWQLIWGPAAYMIAVDTKARLDWMQPHDKLAKRPPARYAKNARPGKLDTSGLTASDETGAARDPL